MSDDLWWLDLVVVFAAGMAAGLLLTRMITNPGGELRWDSPWPY